MPPRKRTGAPMRDPDGRTSAPVPAPPGPPAALAATLATTPDAGRSAIPARFALLLRPEQDPAAVAAAARRELAGLGALVTPLSALDDRVLVLELPGRVFTDEPAAAFAAGHALAADLGLAAAEPDLPTDLFPEPTQPDRRTRADAGLESFPPGCFVPPEPALDADPAWPLSRMGVPPAWAFSDAAGRPSRGRGIVVAQPDTGITVHAELVGVATVAGFDVVDDDPDPTDPLDGQNPGHGTGTASVLISPASRIVTGSAPLATLMPIRAVESVVRITQVSVARAVDWAVGHGAHVITMSLGGLPAIGLQRALQRAVAADVIVLAAAGNCVRLVVWPARYDECIAVAGTNASDGLWPGTCRGAAVDISAPAQNLLKADARPGEPGGAAVSQAQGTSYAVALTAGVAALWLAHHGRPELVGAARARGETLQVMFRRLLQATARRPAGWDPFAMGPGIVDARALLAADLDLGRNRDAGDAPADPAARAAVGVASLVAEDVGPAAVLGDELDWNRFGPELALTLLSQRLPGAGPHRERLNPPAGPSPQLAAAVRNPALRSRLGLDPTPTVTPRPGAPVP